MSVGNATAFWTFQHCYSILRPNTVTTALDLNTVTNTIQNLVINTIIPSTTVAVPRHVLSAPSFLRVRSLTWASGDNRNLTPTHKHLHFVSSSHTRSLTVSLSHTHTASQGHRLRVPLRISVARTRNKGPRDHVSRDGTVERARAREFILSRTSREIEGSVPHTPLPKSTRTILIRILPNQQTPRESAEVCHRNVETAPSLQKQVTPLTSASPLTAATPLLQHPKTLQCRN